MAVTRVSSPAVGRQTGESRSSRPDTGGSRSPYQRVLEGIWTRRLGRGRFLSLASGPGGGSFRRLGDELDEIATRVVEDGDDRLADVGRWLGEGDPVLGQPVVLGLDVVDGELREGNAVRNQRVPVWLHRGVACRFQEQLGPTRSLGRDHGDPGVPTERDVVAQGEAEDLGVERQRCPLVVHVDAGQVDLHVASFQDLLQGGVRPPSNMPCDSRLRNGLAGQRRPDPARRRNASTTSRLRDGCHYGVTMECDDYRCAALRTARDRDAPDEFMHLVLGLVGEAGEIAEKVKKLVRDQNSDLARLDRDDMAGELGDVLWYTAVLASFLGLSLNDVAQRNVDKLADRERRAVIGGSGDSR